MNTKTYELNALSIYIPRGDVMASIAFEKAVKFGSKLRMALVGPSGAGKTYTSLAIGTRLGKRVALIDTEHGSARKFADEFTFDTCSIDSFHPQVYMEAIKAAQAAGYDVIIVDSLSHAWMGTDGALALVDKAAMRSQSGGNKFAAWRDVTPLHNALVETILQCDAHVIATMRAKTEYVVEKDSNGRTQIRKLGLAPVQRDGIEYEFDVVADVDHSQNFIVSKSRCSSLTGAVVNRAGAETAGVLLAWLNGEEAPKPAQMKPAVKPVEKQETPKNVEQVHSPDNAVPPPPVQEKAKEPEEPKDTQKPTAHPGQAGKTVSERVDDGFAFLRRKYKLAPEGEAYGRSLICKQFNVESIDRIDNALSAQVSAYCKGKLQDELRGESFIPLIMKEAS